MRGREVTFDAVVAMLPGVRAGLRAAAGGPVTAGLDVAALEERVDALQRVAQALTADERRSPQALPDARVRAVAASTGVAESTVRALLARFAAASAWDGHHR